MILYYPNGKLYALETYKNDTDLLFIECRDTSGKVIAENGNGNWLNFKDNFTKVDGGGTLKDSLEEGEWRGTIGDTGKFICVYKGGKVISGSGFDKYGKEYPFTKKEVPPRFKGGNYKFSQFLARNIKYPKSDKENNIQGKVFVTFTIEKDGSLTNVRALRGPGISLESEAIRAI